MATFAMPAARPASSPASRRQVLLVSFLLFLALCASIAYWGMQMFKPTARPVAPAPQTQAAAINTTSAATLFGGKSGDAASNAGNFQLQGVVLASSLANTSVIMSVDGKPAQAFRGNQEIAPGVKVKEVHPGYVVLDDNGASRRVELPAELKAISPADAARTDPRVAAQRNTPPPRTMPPAARTPTPNTSSGAQTTSPAQQTQQTQQQPQQAQQTPQPTVGPGVPVPATQAPVANPGASSGASGTAGTVSSGASGTGGAVTNGAQQPVYVQSPPSMGGVTGQTQIQQPGQAVIPSEPAVVHGGSQQLPGTTPRAP